MPRSKVAGTITLVQEHRFRLVDPEGMEHLFILAHDAPLEGRDLERLQWRQRQVAVTYAPAPALIAAIAYDVTPNSRRRMAARTRTSR